MNPSSMAAVMTPAGVLWFLAIITVATVLHELAHYALARWQGVGVQSFSVGMGPILWRKQWKGTEWRVSLLPIGGYVEIDGMAPEEDAEGQLQPPTGGFAGLPNLGKIAVLLAGPLINLLLALMLLTTVLSVQGVPQVHQNQAQITDVVAGSRAEKLGIQAGDTITAINGQPLKRFEEVGQTLKRDGQHRFTILRKGQPRDIPFVWQAQKNGERQLLGIRYTPLTTYQKMGVGAAFAKSVDVTVQAVPEVLRAFGNLFSRFLTLNISQDQNVSGPIGTAEMVSRAAAIGPWALVEIAIMLNLSLAFFNLLPIPGLDGGRILLVLIGALRGKPLSFRQEQAIHFMGFATVMLLMLFVVVRDLVRFM